MRINRDVEGGRFKITEEGNLVKTNFEFERALLEEFELYCKEHHLDFDETVRSMIEALTKNKEASARLLKQKSLVE